MSAGASRHNLSLKQHARPDLSSRTWRSPAASRRPASLAEGAHLSSSRSVGCMSMQHIMTCPCPGSCVLEEATTAQIDHCRCVRDERPAVGAVALARSGALRKAETGLLAAAAVAAPLLLDIRAAHAAGKASACCAACASCWRLRMVRAVQNAGSLAGTRLSLRTLRPSAML